MSWKQIYKFWETGDFDDLPEVDKKRIDRLIELYRSLEGPVSEIKQIIDGTGDNKGFLELDVPTIDFGGYRLPSFELDRSDFWNPSSVGC